MRSKRGKKYFKWWRAGAGAGAGQGKGWREPLMPDQNIFPDETYFCQRCMFIFFLSSHFIYEVKEGAGKL